MMFAVSTGNWIGQLTGVSKYMNRDNYLSPLTDLRRVKSSLDSSRDLYAARDVHGTHWGRICPIETPDGPNCGLSKNLALMAKITTDTDPSKVKEVLKNEELQL
jgi:DNA-directed RNA polymerase beta subunit